MARNGPGGGRTGDASFLAFADQYRQLLRGTAYLLVAEPRRAEHLASTVIARRYPDPNLGVSGLLTSLAELVRPRPAYADPPWRKGDRVELTDHRPPALSPVVLELQRLSPGPRASLVLRLYTGLSSAEAAQVRGVEPEAVEADLDHGVGQLTGDRPERSSHDRLRDDLHAAVALHLARQTGQPSARTDADHGRQLVRRSRLRQAAALVAAVLVVVLGTVGVVRSTSTPVSSPEPTLAPSSTWPTPSRPPGAVVALCDVKNPECQATVMRQWRTEMARVAASHLDPDGTYFTGYRFSYEPRYDSPGFWAGRGGALGLDLYRESGGRTEVYLQIATGFEYAVRCGRTTEQRCQSQRFMDGNRFTLSSSTQLSRGLEVQHRPNGDQTITVVARTTSRGKTLELTRGDLLNLIQDPRLRLPEI